MKVFWYRSIHAKENKDAVSIPWAFALSNSFTKQEKLYSQCFSRNTGNFWVLIQSLFWFVLSFTAMSVCSRFTYISHTLSLVSSCFSVSQPLYRYGRVVSFVINPCNVISLNEDHRYCFRRLIRLAFITANYCILFNVCLCYFKTIFLWHCICWHQLVLIKIKLCWDVFSSCYVFLQYPVNSIIMTTVSI